MKTKLEEAAEKYYESNIDQSNIPREHYESEIQDLMCGFAHQWQQERSYTEEDLKEMLHHALYTPKRDGYLININDSIVRETIAKFKKK